MSAPLNFEGEAWLARRLEQHGANVFEGDTTQQTRCERFRQIILSNGFSSVTVGRRAGKPESYQQYFERLYGVPL